MKYISYIRQYYLTNQKLSFPFTGRFSSFAFNMRAEFTDGSYAYITNAQDELFEIVPKIEKTLNTTRVIISCIVFNCAAEKNS